LDELMDGFHGDVWTDARTIGCKVGEVGQEAHKATRQADG
jgi:hypothetical protein